MRPLTRIRPAAPAAAYKTFAISAPRSTHWRDATCREAGCRAYLNGWQTIVPADSPQAEYIRHDKSRRHTETREPGGLACFTFEPGQEAFAGAHEHKVRIGRPERFIERGGDWRGNPTQERRVHVHPADWQDSFASHQDRLRTISERG